MKKKISSISVIWKSTEKESIDGCSKKMYNFFVLLKNHNEILFGKWYEKGMSKKKALEGEIRIEQNYFYEVLKKKLDKRFPDLGVRVSYWTGHNEENKSAGISFNLCAYGAKSFNNNSCVIDLPSDNDYYEGNNKMRELIKLMVNFWKPDNLLIDGDKSENVVTYLR